MAEKNHRQPRDKTDNHTFQHHRQPGLVPFTDQRRKPGLNTKHITIIMKTLFSGNRGILNLTTKGAKVHHAEIFSLIYV
jgi:hypothetical protein